jgi:hypothetical protein
MPREDRNIMSVCLGDIMLENGAVGKHLRSIRLIEGIYT